MKNKLLLILILISTNIFSADISGNVYLDNTIDFSNCTITFTPVSPSAIFGQTTSQTNGNFTANIENGVYNIKYEKKGYQTYELLNFFVNGIMTLDNVTLSSNNLVIVNGNVKGSWTKGNTYKVTGDITVPYSETLNIEEGVEIKFDGYYSLIVNGKLLANGSPNNYIKFTSNKTSPTNKDWNQILINSSESSKMDYCIIEYGKMHNDNGEALLDIRGNFDLSNTIIRYSDETGVVIKGTGKVDVNNCKINNCLHGIAANGTGIITLQHNEVYDNTYYGISVGMGANSTTVKENIIYNCNYIGLGIASNIKAERNIVVNNKYYGIFVSYSKPTIVNNTVMFNENGIGLYDNETYMITNPIINSNIISNNLYYGIHSKGVNKPDSVSYNLFYNNGSGIGNVLPVGVGPIITTNINKTPADAYYNIFVDPELESTTLSDTNFCFLKTQSPAINAGDPKIKTTEDIIDIGAIELEGNLSIQKNNTVSKINIFPNPVLDFITFQSNNTFNSINIFDVNGKYIEKIKLPIPTAEYKWETPAKIITGIYFYQIMNDQKIIDSGKFIKN